MIQLILGSSKDIQWNEIERKGPIPDWFVRVD